MGQHPGRARGDAGGDRRAGLGAGGTRNISGTNTLHVALERELATLHGKEAALVFTSGYVANEATLQTLGAMLPGCVIYSDAYNHASMIAGIRHSGAVRRIFRHNDLAHLEELLAAADPATPKIVALRIGLLDGRRHLADRRDLRPRPPLRRARPISTRCMPSACTASAARGMAERDGVLDKVDVVQGTLAKAFGVIGGYIASTAATVDFVRSCAGLHLHDLDAAARSPARRAGQRPPRHGPAGAARAPPGARRDAEAPARRGRPAGDAVGDATSCRCSSATPRSASRRPTCCWSATRSTCSRSTTRPCRAAPSGCG